MTDEQKIRAIKERIGLIKEIVKRHKKALMALA